MLAGPTAADLTATDRRADTRARWPNAARGRLARAAYDILTTVYIPRSGGTVFSQVTEKIASYTLSVRGDSDVCGLQHMSASSSDGHGRWSVTRLRHQLPTPHYPRVVLRRAPHTYGLSTVHVAVTPWYVPLSCESRGLQGASRGMHLSSRSADWDTINKRIRIV
jgi:hypothetical protein